jgi:hypothetical protein
MRVLLQRSHHACDPIARLSQGHPFFDCSPNINHARHNTEGGHLNLVNLLLENGADVNKATIDDGTTPLSIAAERGHLHAVLALLRARADPALATIDETMTPLFMAAQEGRLATVQHLVAFGVRCSCFVFCCGLLVCAAMCHCIQCLPSHQCGPHHASCHPNHAPAQH